jgi:lysine 2,3-aminomutase
MDDYKPKSFLVMNTQIIDAEVQKSEIEEMLTRFHLSPEIIATIATENLLPIGLLHRLHTCYPQHSGLFKKQEAIFTGKTYYSGLKGFREIVAHLQDHGINIGHIKEREFFIDVYRFLATRHALNTINWDDFENDRMYHLIFPQPGMISAEETQKYIDADTDEAREKVVIAYQKKTNPHDGKQMLNKPWYINDDGHLEILQGCQHKYPPVKLILDKTTQNCFAFCTYCFRHAQVRGDEDMFVQEEVSQVHNYLREHKEVSDVLITGGDGGFITYDRLLEYALPLIEDPELLHVKTLRIGSRALSFHPEMILSDKFKHTLELFKKLIDNGIQLLWVAHLSFPSEVLNPSTIAAIRRLKSYGVTIKSQSPIMHHISLFNDESGEIDIDKSAQNWIDLGNILAMLGIGFHSMYCARPTGEHHYFTAPLAAINKIFSKVYRTLASINRPSRYITMTSSAGKTSLLGTAEVNGETVFVLKFNEARNMEWMDKVYLAEYDEQENTIEKLKPYQSDKYFYHNELVEIENRLDSALRSEIKKEQQHDK